MNGAATTHTTDEEQGPEEVRFGLGKSLLFSAILIVSTLTLAEIAIRTWAHFLRDDVERWDSASETFVLLPGAYRSSGYDFEINSAGFVGRELEPPGPDLVRLYALGDSCTFGGGNSRDTYPAMLGGLLDESEAPGTRYEVVNAGISGMNSQLALRRLESVGPPLEPDVVTIYVGWNDLMKYDPRAQSKESEWSGVARALDNLWLAKGLRKLLFFYVRPRVSAPATGADGRTGAFADFDPAIYEENLAKIIETVRAMGAAPVLVTLASVVSEDMTPTDLREQQVMFPYFASAYGVGDFLDVIAAYNRTIRETAERLDVPVADSAAAFEVLPDKRPYFYDTMHPNRKGMAIIARTLNDALFREGVLPVPESAAP